MKLKPIHLLVELRRVDLMNMYFKIMRIRDSNNQRINESAQTGINQACESGGSKAVTSGTLPLYFSI